MKYTRVMTDMYEGAKDADGLSQQFTSCCGATDKGVDDGIVCRKCYRYIVEYFGEGYEAEFIEMIESESLVVKFKERFIAKGKN